VPGGKGAGAAGAAPVTVLLLSRYDEQGASSRQRFYQFVDGLSDAGMRIAAAPLLSAAYLDDLYRGRPVDRGAVARAYRDRLIRLVPARYDLLWVEKEVFPWVPAWLETLLVARRRAALVVDYDDAIFHRYDEARSPVVRSCLGRKIDRVMRAADLVTVGNDYLYARAAAAGARRVARLPTVVDPRRYAPRPWPDAPGVPFTIGWIGTPVTSPYLEMLRPVLSALAVRLPIRILLVGAAADALAGLPVERRPWSRDSEARMIAEFDVGIMPLPDAPWERGKCGYKLVQYMAGGIPTIASPVGINAQIVAAPEAGFVAATPQEWAVSFDRLAADRALRAAMGAAGRSRVERLYSIDAVLPQLASLLRQTIALRRRSVV
jgi:hypothetical protein